MTLPPGLYDRLLTDADRLGDADERAPLGASEAGAQVAVVDRLIAALEVELDRFVDREDRVRAEVLKGVAAAGVVRPELPAGRPLRLLTTTYRGVTQGRVLDDLVALGARHPGRASAFTRGCASRNRRSTVVASARRSSPGPRSESSSRRVLVG